MAVELRTGWANRRCMHLYPARVTTEKEDRRRARCLGCGQLGPPRMGLAAALSALRDRFPEPDVGKDTRVAVSRMGERFRLQG
jgi:hypothetical protein